MYVTKQNASQPDSGLTDVVVTPEMIDAGAWELVTYGSDVSDVTPDELITRAFRAMVLAQRQG